METRSEQAETPYPEQFSVEDCLYRTSRYEGECLSAADCEATHPGFTMTCKTCGGSRVYVDSDVGFSAVSGGWGGVRLNCSDCHSQCEIWQAY